MTPIRTDQHGDLIYIDPENGGEYELDTEDPEVVQAVQTLLAEEEAANAEASSGDTDQQLEEARAAFFAEEEKRIGRKLTAAEVQKVDSYVQKHDELPESDKELYHDLDSEEGRQAWMTEAASRPTVGGFAISEESDDE